MHACVRACVRACVHACMSIIDMYDTFVLLIYPINLFVLRIIN